MWGTGTPRREFLYVDDLADACVFVMKHYSGEDFLNVGTGEDITIAEFAAVVAETVGYQGEFVYDTVAPGRHAAQAARRVAASCLGLAPQE